MGTIFCGALGALGVALRAAHGAAVHFLITLAGIAVGLGADITDCTLAKCVFTGIGHTPPLVTYVFLLMSLPYVGAVTCIHCKDRFDPSGHTSDNCPTITVVVSV